MKQKFIEVPPVFTTYETKTPGLSGKDVGNEFRALLNYEVIERTKSFTIIKVNYVHTVTTKRQF